MAHVIKIRRSGIERIFRKMPLREWLDEQPRKELTYLDPKTTSASEFAGKGWRTEDFIRECWKRGLDVRIGTANKWLSGSKPRNIAAHELKKAFPNIKL